MGRAAHKALRDSQTAAKEKSNLTPGFSRKFEAVEDIYWPYPTPVKVGDILTLCVKKDN